MGQIFSWFRPPRDSLPAQDVAAEEQSQPKQTASTAASQVSGAKPAESQDVPIASTKAAAAKPAVTRVPDEIKLRPQEMKPTKTPETPKKPLSTDAALDALSAGFDSSAAQSKEKKKPVVEDIGAADVLSATLSNVSPPPADSQATQKKAESKKPAVGSGSRSEAPPADKKARMHEDAGPAAPKPSGDQKTKKEEGTSMSADALSALEDLLPSAEPEPEPPKVQPKDIVTEAKLKSEKGVRVGEREDTLPADYRFTEDKLKEFPAPKKEPSMDAGEALDLLSGDFVSPVAAPEPPKQAKKDDHTLDALSKDFVAPAKAPSVQAPVPPPSRVPQQKDPQPSSTSTAAGPKSVEDTSMSAEALSALEDLLPSAEPEPEPPKVQPKDIVTEAKLKSEKGVRVGEREDTLPPDYRFTEDKLKEFPAPKKEVSLDFGDVVTPGVAPVVQAAAVHPPPAGRQLSEGTASALDALSDTLTDDTPAPAPAPVPAKNIVKEKTAVEEKAVKTGERDDSLPPEYRPSEKDVLAKKDVKHVAPKQPSLDDATALGLLSSDFDAPAAPAAPAASAPVTKAASAASAPVTKATPAAAAPKVTSTTTPAVQSSEKAKPKAPLVEPTQKATGAVMDALSSTLLPDVPAFKPKAAPTDEKAEATSSNSKSKPKKPEVNDGSTPHDLSAQSQSDVVTSSATKKGSKS